MIILEIGFIIFHKKKIKIKKKKVLIDKCILSVRICAHKLEVQQWSLGIED